jgi:lantibiotic biosynthesis protein
MKVKQLAKRLANDEVIPISEPAKSKTWDKLPWHEQDEDTIRGALSDIERGLLQYFHCHNSFVSTKDSPTLLDPATHMSLSNGLPGILLFYGYTRAYRKELNNDDTIEELLCACLDRYARVDMPPALYEGVFALPYVLSVLGKIIPMRCDEKGIGRLENAIFSYLNSNGRRLLPEFVNGLSGLGLYFMRASGGPLARDGAKLCISLIAEKAEIKENHGNITWFTKPEGVPLLAQELYPDGYYDIGLAHGVSGILAFLAESLLFSADQQIVREILPKAVDWLLSTEQNDDPAYRFPSRLVPGASASASKLAWCYGDLSVAIALLWCGRAMCRPDWTQSGLRLATEAAEHSLNKRWEDICLCHGSAGVGHIFNRLYQAYDLAIFAEASMCCLIGTLRARKKKGGIAGFRARLWDSAGKPIWDDNPGLLNGAAGVGLALLAALSDQEPMWDSCMLLDMPPHSS